MKMTKRHLVLLIVIIVTGAMVHLAGIAAKSFFTHDEAVSYISATGHQAEFSRIVAKKIYPYGTWCKASEWKKFWNIDKHFCLGQIKSDLLYNDIHPPLYFWLLHFWILIFDVHLWTGPTLNLLIDLMTALALYKLGREVFDDNASAVLVVAVWLLSPSVIENSLVARQYSLLVLFCVLLSIYVLKFAKADNTLDTKTFVAVTLITTAGILTHYHFVLLIGASLLWLAYVLRSCFSRLIKWMCCIGMGFLLSFASNSKFYLQLQTFSRQKSPVEFNQLANRLLRVVCSMLPYRCKDIISRFELPLPVSLGIFLVAGVIVLVAIIILIKRKLGFRNFDSLLRQKLFYMVFTFLCLWGIISVQYLTFNIPEHVMGGRYLAMAWPFFAFIVIMLIHYCPVIS